MTIWSISTENFATLVNAVTKYDESLIYAVTLTPTENIDGAFLYTDSDYDGYVFAQLSGWAAYKALDTYNTETSCFVGTLISGTGYNFNIKIVVPEISGLSGEHIIPIRLGSGGTPPMDHETIFEDTNDFWYASTEEADAGWWR